MLFRLLYFKVVILKHSQFQKHYFYLLTALNSCRSSPSEVITNTVSLVCLSIRGYQTNCYVDHIFCLIYNTLILLIQKVYILIMCPLKFKVIQYDINATFLLTMLGNVKLKGVCGHLVPLWIRMKTFSELFFFLPKTSKKCCQVLTLPQSKVAYS